MTMTDDNTTSNNTSISIHSIFQTVTSMVQSSSPPLPLSDDIKLQLYGLYKRATVGTTTTEYTDNNNDNDDSHQPPSRWNVVAYRKYQAWLACDYLTQEESMIQYVELISSLDCDLGKQCLDLLQQFRENGESNERDESNGQQKEVEQIKDEKVSSSTTSTTSTLNQMSKSNPSLFTKYTGIEPFIPRGQVDITTKDLLSTFIKTVPTPFNKISSMRKTIQLENKIEQVWKESIQNNNYNNNDNNNMDKDMDNNHIITGLSVRSLLDLYLSSKSFDVGSEVIIVPPISIEGMIDVLQYHNMKIVPIDIDPFDDEENKHPIIHVNLDKVRDAITAKTVAIMIVHPFGLVCMKESEMKKLRNILDDVTKSFDNSHIEIWEDCAECYTGCITSQHGYVGSSYADIQFFSFGVIKTATALGGGIAIIKETSKTKTKQRLVVDKMKRIQHMTYEQQSNYDYFTKLSKVIILQLCSRNWILLGIIVQLLNFFGIDYDNLVTSSVKGFPHNEKWMHGKDAEQKKKRAKSLIQRLRKRPCPALLSLLHRRLLKSKQTHRTVFSRINRCQKMQTLLETMIPSIKIPTSSSDTIQHLFWLFPIIVNDPASVSRAMMLRGFDVPRGTSQLGCVTSFASDSDNITACPNTELMMKRVLYLPMASIDLNLTEMTRICDSLRTCIVNNGPMIESSKKNKIVWSNLLLYAIILLLADALMSCQIPFSSECYYFTKWLIKTFVPLAFSIGCIVIILLHIIRVTIGNYYINCSNAFAKYGSIFNENDKASTQMNNSMLKDLDDLNIVDTTSSFQQSSDLFENKCFELPDIKESNEKREHDASYVLLTGATGFIGSLLLRDLLMNRKRLGIKGVVLICRPKRKISAAERITKLLEKPMFSFLTQQEKQDSVIVVQGDVASPYIGLSEVDMQLLRNGLNISHVFNCAACVKFDEPLEKAAESNITSALQLQLLTKNLKNKNALYVYLSTAFIHGNLNGSSSKPLPEELFNFGPYDPVQLYESMMSTQSYASKAMHDLGFPNSYTFSKSICEHLLLKEQKQSTVIIRPSIVGPSITSPYEGWAGEKPSTLVAGACLYMKNPYNLWTFRREQAPVIPVDVVSRFVLSKAFSVNINRSPLRYDDESSKLSEESGRSSESSYVFTTSSSVKTYLSDTDSSVCSSEEQTVDHYIFTAAWDSKSPTSTGFLWYDFACAIVQLSSFNGHVGYSVAYFVLLVSFRIFLAMNMTFESFQRVHRILVHYPMIIGIRFCRLIGHCPNILQSLEKLRPFLDLPLLFFPFTTTTFYFKSELIAPMSVNGERYMVSSILAAEKFVNEINTRMYNRESHNKLDASTVFSIGGLNHRRQSDLWWALNQPKGSYIIRLVGLIVSKLLRHTTSLVTVDIESLSKVARAMEVSPDEAKPYIILAPTHRSFFDFILLSYISFSLPEMGISIPNIAAADDFARITVLGWIARVSGAFFIKRGKGIPDPGLKSKLTSIKSHHTQENPVCIEVFLEGKRSRDRRFLKPKTGFLKCLCETGGNHLLVPITVNYERIPEQFSLSKEIDGEIRSKMSIPDLFLWLKEVFSGRINLGQIHVSAAQPILMGASADVIKVATGVQKLQLQKVIVTTFHVETTAQILDVDIGVVEKSFLYLGCRMMSNQANSQPTMSLTEKWSVFLQCGHIFSSFLLKSHPQWSVWLNTVNGDENLTSSKSSEDVDLIIASLAAKFDEAEIAVKKTVNVLNRKGFLNPSLNHIIQYTTSLASAVPVVLIKAAVAMYLKSLGPPQIDEVDMKATSVINPLFCSKNEKNAEKNAMDFKFMESFGAWGFKDSKFVINVGSDGTRFVSMSGDRYSISGKPMPKLLTFLESETKIRVDIMKTSLPCTPPISVSTIELSDRDIELLLSRLNHDRNRVSISPLDRARHGTGHSQEDMYNIRSNSLMKMRLPDAVVFPDSENEVSNLIALAVKQKWCLIPFGGGTNVSHATWCPPKTIEPRPIISVDMRLMNKILKVNKEDSTIHVQAGITGGQLMEEIHDLGLTIGHEPDSIEFSTVGGWIATNSSGMKQNKYGNIEDIVKEVRLATSRGLLWQHNEGDGASFGRVATGTSLKSLVLGSEGSLGIITSAILKVWPLPTKKEFQSILLHNFEDGIRLVKDVAKLGPLKPASIRLLDNTQFRLGQAMKSNSSFVLTLKRLLMRTYTHFIAGNFLPSEIVCATVTFEGTKEEVEIQQNIIRDLALKHGGLCAGSEIGKAGYDMTYAIAYIRDFALTYGFLAESFETFVPWSKVVNLIASTKACLKKEHSDRALPGEPIVSCRITQLYDEGVCVYFYFCINFENVMNPSEIFAEIELAARKVIIAEGGSLSHHHGIGKARADLMECVNPPNVKNLLMAIKNAFDPQNIFGVRNGCFA